MSATFDVTLSNDISKVRFHVGDVDIANAALQDETITALVTSEGTWQKATIAALHYLIALVSKPNFTADWLTVDNKSAREGYQALLSEKRAAFGLAQITATATRVTRLDWEDS